MRKKKKDTAPGNRPTPLMGHAKAVVSVSWMTAPAAHAWNQPSVLLRIKS